jgi:hypothetical protein
MQAIKPSWWHHVDVAGRDVFMNMPFGVGDETAMYTMPPDADAEIKRLKAAMKDLVQYAANVINTPVEECKYGAIGNARKLIEE